ncbi:DUF5655 domain-containing protein [Alteromonas facilis]|uniref:DUF5655 domain-containing protein n=1 Tax=Alteromonas facilis TaxID=2048004 RepID=UPI000C282A7E|nr:DUF5655 domain-containing protein [Alteromonas facilis]
MEHNLQEKTGKTLAEWKAVLVPKGFEKHGEIMAFLKKDCGISHGFANFIALKFREADAASQAPDDLIKQQYQSKPNLLPIFEHLTKHIMAIGDDIDMAPKKANVSFRRKRQFVLVQPSTKSRIDIGLKFNDRPCEGRLEPSGPFGTMCSHRVQITDISQVDEALLDLIKAAYAEA